MTQNPCSNKVASSYDFKSTTFRWAIQSNYPIGKSLEKHIQNKQASTHRISIFSIPLRGGKNDSPPCRLLILLH